MMYVVALILLGGLVARFATKLARYAKLQLAGTAPRSEKCEVCHIEEVEFVDSQGRRVGTQCR